MATPQALYIDLPDIFRIQVFTFQDTFHLHFMDYLFEL